MGSMDKAVISGFICRLCSKMNRFVIHIYGEEGDRMRLAEKINVYLPITININDPLPKTVCVPCIDRLETHHQLMQQFSLARQRLTKSTANDQASDSSGTEAHPEGSNNPSPGTNADVQLPM